MSSNELDPSQERGRAQLPSEGMKLTIDGPVVHIDVDADDFELYFDLLSGLRVLPNRTRANSSDMEGDRFLDSINPRFATPEDAQRFTEIIGEAVDRMIELRGLAFDSDQAQRSS